MSGFVYIICHEGQTGPVKVGVAGDPQARLKQLQTGNPQRLKLFATVQARSRGQAEAWELFAHKLFEDRRLVGEWFEVPAQELLDRISEWKRDGEPKPPPTRSLNADRRSTPWKPSVPSHLARKRLRDMTDVEKLEFWGCFDLPTPPSGFDDWYIVGNHDHGVLAAFPVVGYVHGEAS